ncbi:MAG: hypothetical protein ACQR33_06770 [Candidatus Saccharibacteria bacterium]
MEFEPTRNNVANPNLIIEDDLSREFAEGVLRSLAKGELLVQDGSFDALVQSFEAPTPLDSYQTVSAMAQTVPVIAHMLGGKTGVRESYRLHEHTQAVLNGFEADYADVYPDPQDRKLLRTTLLLQDMGKSLCIAHCGNRREQSPYNAAVVDNLLASIAETTLDADDKQTIRLLLSHDILGGALKGYKGIEESVAQAEIDQLKQFTPEKYQDRYLDLMRVVYMADVSAYTDYRSYVSAEDGQKTPCLPALNKEYQVLTADPDSGKVIFKEQARNDLLARLTGLA